MAIEKIVINGITEDGTKFRPSDWTERLYYSLATYGPNRRLSFNPLVHLKQGENYKCFVIDARLEDEEPMTYDFLIDFAKSNNLVIVDQDDNPVDL